MKPPGHRPWGLRDWALFLTCVTGAFSALGFVWAAFHRGSDAINGYVDTRARTVATGVVHDSLDAHRHDQHRHGRRR